MADRCRTCRFWRLDILPSEVDPGEHINPGFGWCRRSPPKIIDHMARMAIRQPGFGGNIVDADEVASASHVEDATLFPATFGDSWCGEWQSSKPEMPFPC